MGDADRRECASSLVPDWVDEYSLVTCVVDSDDLKRVAGWRDEYIWVVYSDTHLSLS